MRAWKFYNKDRLLKRLKSKTKITDDNHWLWMGKRNIAGYGTMRTGSKSERVEHSTSRISAFIHLGLDLNDKTQYALHKNTCPYKSCWNPNCLYVGTHADNMQDMGEKQKSTNSVIEKSPRIYCKHGHLLSEHSFLIRRSVWDHRAKSVCRICRSKRNRNYRERKREKKQQKQQQT